MIGRTLIVVLLMTSAALADQPTMPRTPGCPLQTESPAWLANGALTENMQLPPLRQGCEISSQQQSSPETPTGIPGQYYPDPMLQRDYMLMVRPPTGG